MKEIIEIKRHKIKWRTCFSSISNSGYKLDILKSGMQKYLRRRECDKMIWCISEIYLFYLLAVTNIEKQATKGIITNMLNRLIIMMDEEMLFIEVDKYIKCMEWINEFKNNNDKIKVLVKICKTLINCKMLRLNSDIYSYWWKGVEIYKVVKINREYVFEDDVITVCNELLSIEEKNSELWKKEKINLMMFIKNFKNNNNSCYYWALKMYNSDVIGKTRFKRKYCIYVIWEYLFKLCKNNEKLKKCLELKLNEFNVKNRKERHLWLISSIGIMLNKDNIKFNEWNVDVSDKEIINIFKSRKKLIIDNYVIDMHCGAGRKLNKNSSDFALIGSLVIDEDKEYYNKKWRKLYNDLKINYKNYKIKKLKIVDEFKKNNSEMLFIDGSLIKEKDIKICMEKTCGNKVMCFEYDNKIWKESRQSFNYNKDYELVDNCKEIFNLNKIGMTRIKSNFKIEKIDKTKSEWCNNWRKININSNEKVIYCCMRKIGSGENISKNKNREKILENRNNLIEIAKIAIFRGIFRVTDFNLRNILVDNDSSLVSIDEGDIGKKQSIFGNKWIKKYLSCDIVSNAYKDIINNKNYKKLFIINIMKTFNYSKIIIDKVINNYDNLENDIKQEKYM